MESLVTLLVGHRGAGKTTYLRGLRSIWAGELLDLDEEIERVSGVSIAHLLNRGEREFRTVEQRVLHDLIDGATSPTVIAVGAGYEGPLPTGAHVIWIRRETDASGRVFLNRPRLNPNISPFQEYLQRLPERTARYSEWAHEQLFVPEGYCAGLESFVLQSGSAHWHLPFDLTLFPENLRRWSGFWKKRLAWGIRRFELRDDLLTTDQMETVLRSVPHEHLLFSRRKPVGVAPADLTTDWALELGPPLDTSDVVSLHQRTKQLSSDMARLNEYESSGRLLKLAVEIRDFNELRLGHEWWREAPEHRAFLPRSADGRWRWYRSLFGPMMPIHFIREGIGSGLDQPLLWQTLMQPLFRAHFGAVLGSPVRHSRSPVEHLPFAREQGLPFVAIDMHEDEFSAAVPLLRAWGLRFAAVTAPLKKLAFAVAEDVHPDARTFHSANSLFLDESGIRAHNTDALALKRIRGELPDYKLVWLWGGGGVKASVRAAWPEIVEISAREGTQEERVSPELLIWAVGRSREFRWPPSHLRPERVLDLNYTEDSPGLEWAVQRGLSYQSGLRMFELQAEFQRCFWSECESQRMRRKRV
ncbi:MAG: shikimate kinase [Bdellovibrionales bacterium]